MSLRGPKGAVAIPLLHLDCFVAKAPRNDTGFILLRVLSFIACYFAILSARAEAPKIPADYLTAKPKAVLQHSVAKKEIDAALQNVEGLSTQARAVPNFQDGKLLGMKLWEVDESSLFAKMGLRKTDVILSVNGIPIDLNNPSLFGAENKTSLTYRISRKGELIDIQVTYK